MSLLKKAIKKVVTGDLSEMVGKNKHDVKVAKLELKKARIDQQTIKAQEEKDAVSNIVNYVGENIDYFEEYISSFTEEAQILIDTYASGDRKTRRKLSCNVDERLKYLYLCKSFFSLLSKAASGLSLNDNTKRFIIQFMPFFDGVKVLSESDYKDDSVLGEFREVGVELASAFISTKKPFSFDDFLGDYADKREALLIPDIQASIILFKGMYEKAMDKIEARNPAQDTTLTTVCPNCNALITGNTKFCPECGTKLVPQKLFCSSCGNKCDPGVKFCPFCGNRI